MAWHAVAYLRHAVPRTGRIRHSGPGRWAGPAQRMRYKGRHAVTPSCLLPDGVWRYGLALYSAPREHAVSLVQILEHVLPNNAVAHYPLHADTPLRGGR